MGDEESIIVKALAGAYFEFSGGAFVYTRSLTDAVTRDAAAWNAQPLVVQRKMDGVDVRVVVVGEQVFGAACETNMIDWRLERSSEWTPWSVPGGIAEKCRSYLEALGLKYAAFDFIDDGKDVWFLEANQAGEWAFIERSLNLGISEALASLLTGLARRG